MEYAGIVYEMRPSVTEEQPFIDFEAHGFWEEWEELDQSIPPGVDTLICRQLSFTVDHPLANEWDWYSLDVMGAMSQRACRVLWDYLKVCCRRFQTAINGREYFILRPSGDVRDCVDRTESILEAAPDDPNWFLDAKRLRFQPGSVTDPLLFIVPERPSTLLATESIRQLVRDAGLNGFEFIDCEQLRGYM